MKVGNKYAKPGPPSFFKVSCDEEKEQYKFCFTPPVIHGGSIVTKYHVKSTDDDSWSIDAEDTPFTKPMTSVNTPIGFYASALNEYGESETTDVFNINTGQYISHVTSMVDQGQIFTDE